MHTTDSARQIVAEGIGTALLLAAVVGSGIMGERLAGGNDAIALLANAVATGAALVFLILTFGPISGAHLNPAVTIADASQGGLRWSLVPGYVVAQIVGACLGVVTAHVMFGERLLMASLHERSGPAQMFSEFVDLGVFAPAIRHGSFCGGGLHHLGILVHGLNIFCDPGGDRCSRVDGYVRWH
jgi:glycerol uptake facilitator-like aquaporin